LSRYEGPLGLGVETVGFPREPRALQCGAKLIINKWTLFDKMEKSIQMPHVIIEAKAI